MKKTMLALVAASFVALAAAACTPAQEQAAVTGVQAACSAAAIGTTVYVQVASQSGGAAAQTISKQVQGDVGSDCPTIAAATKAAVDTITASGGVAQVSVSTSAPVSLTRRMIGKYRVRKVAGESQIFVVVPGPFDEIAKAF